MGQSSYSASNAYLDGLVDSRLRNGLCGLSIRWPAISDIGMAATTMVNHSADALSISMNPGEVKSFLHRILVRASDAVCCSDLTDFPTNITGAVITIVPGGLAEFLSRDALKELENVMQKMTMSTKKALMPDKASNRRRSGKSKKKVRSSNADIWTKESIAETVYRVVCSLIDTSDIPLDVPLMDLGLDSLGASELSGRLSSELGVKVLPTLVFSYPTLGEIQRNMIESVLGSDIPEFEDDEVTAVDSRYTTRPQHLCRSPRDESRISLVSKGLAARSIQRVRLRWLQCIKLDAV